MAIQESGEMYLETILILSKSKDKVRAIDIADHMNYSKPSVSRGLGLLKDEGYISVDEGNNICLTEVGLKHAEKIYERHIILTKMFTSLGVDEKVASDDACKIEHVISDETFEALKKRLK